MKRPSTTVSALLALTACITCAKLAHADVLIPNRLLRLDLHADLLSSEVSLAADPMALTHANLSLHDPSVGYVFGAGIDLGRTLSGGDEAIGAAHAMLGWQWYANGPSSHERSVLVNLRVSGAWSERLTHPLYPRGIRAGTLELAPSISWAHELKTRDGKTHGMTLLAHLEPSVYFAPDAPVLNVMGRAGVSYLFPSTWEAQLHMSAETDVASKGRRRLGVHSEVRAHLCADNAPRLRRAWVESPMSRCPLSVGVWGWAEPLTSDVRALPWSAGLRLDLRLPLSTSP